jgi:hypothetical protein
MSKSVENDRLGRSRALTIASVAGSAFIELACPACATGQDDGPSGALLVGALVLLPLAAALVAGLVILRLLRR